MNRIVYGGLVGGLLALVTTAMGCGSNPCNDLAACSACDSACQSALVAAGNADACNAALAQYNMLNLCGGGPVPDGGNPPPDVPNAPPDVANPPPDTNPPPDVTVLDEVNPPPPDMTVVTVSPENVGNACTPDAMGSDDANCGAAQEQICLPAVENGTVGVCSVLFCDQNDELSCGAGNFCVTADQNGTTLCLASCTVAEAGCDTGLTCQPLLGLASVCFAPSCTADAECAEFKGTYCNTDVSTCLNAGSATAAVGDGCTTDADCPRNGLCLDEATFEFPGGYCVTPECNAPAFACAKGDVCTPVPDTGGVCFKGCSADTDCVDSTGAARAGYTCQMGTCAPPANP